MFKFHISIYLFYVKFCFLKNIVLFSDKWIGRRRSIEWPSRSFDFSPFDLLIKQLLLYCKTLKWILRHYISLCGSFLLLLTMTLNSSVILILRKEIILLDFVNPKLYWIFLVTSTNNAPSSEQIFKHFSLK